MKIITKKKFGGKTHELIVMSAISGDYIVCKSIHDASEIQSRAIDMGLHIPLPITYDEFIEKQYSGRNIKGFLIDNVDVLLDYISKIPISAITLTID